jgi:hypothetical protein
MEGGVKTTIHHEYVPQENQTGNRIIQANPWMSSFINPGKIREIIIGSD